jgi:L-aspartate oxidase
LVFGRRAAAAILNAPMVPSKMYLNDIQPWENFGNEEEDPSLIAQDLQTIRGIMWNYVGLERTSRRLARARVELSHAERLVEQFYQNTVISDSLLGLRNIARTAVLVAEAAWENPQSAGCHYRI